ncbi:iron-siderophore ABC transporter substrate-binding protein [Actinomadura craniellae]|uniref:Iron-siderophore ABC transporter substrate-binding protein n=1 Tax=Actinomadura craniellae TaxID=2231787 RepID=A0A365HBL8_9ACTN|nr:iron-siderophore ABC transporter substrate-binding protein [Actinomadura craniellae]RAY16544.1 iron-siderophore ABC transporter substrate-binding protein [Actinomadura craniellae]
MSISPRLAAPRFVAVLLALVLALALAACGGEEEKAATGGASPAGAAFPVSIQHKYGTTEIKSKPTRVVTLGLSDHDAVLALGVKPVGAIDWFKERPYGKWPWTQPLWGSTPPTIVGERDDFQIEKIAALRPDLIIAQYSGMNKGQYEKLSKIAPTVGQSPKYDDYAMPWQEMSRVIGRALGEEKRMNDLIAGIEKRFADARKQYPQWAGKTVAVVEAYEPGKYAVFAPTDPKVDFMKSLGFAVPPKIVQAVGKEYAAEIGSERLDLVEVDRLVFLNSDPAAEKNVKNDRVYKTLKVAQENRALFVPYEEPPVGAALSFMTVLSIPYALDQLLPLLAR